MSRLTEEIRNTFDLAALRLDAAKELNGEEWQSFLQIKKEHDDQRRLLKRSYELEKDKKLTEAKKSLIDKAAGKPRDFVPRWFSRDRFDKTAIERQARLEVRQAYRDDQGKIDKAEAEKLTNLLDRSEHRRALREMPKRDFARAIDRRSGPDRRRRD